MDTQEFVAAVKSGKIDLVEHTHKVIEECKKINEKYHYFNAISEELAASQAKAVAKNPKGRLAGVAVSIKDNICVKDVESKAGSRILTGYKPVFNATVVQKLIDEGAIIIGKTSQDEFGFGSFNTNVGLGFPIPRNPFDAERATGGSSGGSAGITALLKLSHISIAESTGGSIVNPASFCGVYGLCPTYGLVSRYGLIDYGNSLDKIGPMAKSPADISLAMGAISGHDAKDSTSLKHGSFTRLPTQKKKPRIGLIAESMAGATDPRIAKAVLAKLDEFGFEHEEISLNMPLKYGLPVYYILAASEASTNLAKYCGMRYGASEKLSGNFNEYFTKVRSMHFGDEAKRRIILGTFARMAGYRDAYYIKAQKIRSMIVAEYKKVFKRFDAIASPAMPLIAPRIDEIAKLSPLQQYQMDILTVGPNLAGMPHLSIPAGEVSGLPVGMMLTADHLKEDVLLSIAGEGKNI